MKRIHFATLSCYAVFLAIGISGSILGPAYDALTRSLSMPLRDAALFTSTQAIGATLSIIISGWLLDRINARFILAGGVLLMGAGLVMLTAATSTLDGLFACLLIGWGYGCIDVGGNTVIVTLNPERSGAALNLLNVFFGAGAMIGPQLINFGLSRDNFALGFQIAAGFSLLLVIPLAMISVHVGRKPSEGQAPSQIQWLALVPFAVLMFIYVGIEVGYSSWIPTQMSKVALTSESTATFGATIFWMGLTVGRIIASFILHRLSNLAMVILSLVLIAGGVAVLLVFPASESVALLCSFVIGFGCGPIFPTVLAIANDRYPQARGTMSGLLIAVGASGAILLPWVQGQVGGGQNGGMILTFVAAFGMLALTPLMQRRIPVVSAAD